MWWFLPEEVGLLLEARSLVAQLIMCLLIDAFAPQEPLSYVRKRKRKPHCYSSFLMQCTLVRCATTTMAQVDNMRGRRCYRTPGLLYHSYRHMCKKRKLVPQASLTGMTMTWDSRSSPSQCIFDSDAQSLMLDDGASVCITNDMQDFIEPPKRVDKKVKGIKVHADATHRGTIKWHIEDDQGLVHVMIIRGAYLIPDTRKYCRLNIWHSKRTITTRGKREQEPW